MSEQPSNLQPDFPPTPPGNNRSTKLARSLRRQSTPPERILWSRLRNRQLRGLKFRRQHPIGSYVPDFFCEEAKLIIELDGEIHGERRPHDDARDRWMHDHGLETLRFTVSQFMKDQDAVLTAILLAAQRRIVSVADEPSPLPSPSGRGG